MAADLHPQRAHVLPDGLVLRDGEPAGQVISAAWGETVGGSVGLAYVWPGGDGVATPDWIGGGTYQVNIGGRVYPATVSTRPLYDPGNERVRS